MLLFVRYKFNINTIWKRGLGGDDISFRKVFYIHTHIVGAGHCALRARKRGRRSHLTRCNRLLLMQILRCNVQVLPTTVQLHAHMLQRWRSSEWTKQVRSAGRWLLVLVAKWSHSWWWKWWSRVNSAGGFLRKPLDLLHPHQSVMLVSVSQFHHFYSIP